MDVATGWTEGGPDDPPLVATAIHHGHDIRDELRSLLALPDTDRLREEDPYTGVWTSVAPHRYVASTSRFEVDLNRPRATSVYRRPEDAWGLQVWTAPLTDDVAERSRTLHDTFYAEAERVLRSLEARHGRFVVYDIHSYNHRRDGADAPPQDPELNPEVNVGTGTMDRSKRGPVVDAFIDALRGTPFLGRHLDVRENVKFLGGNLASWVHQMFPETGVALAIEFKKIFMDEWTGEAYPDVVNAITDALAETVEPVLEALERM